MRAIYIAIVAMACSLTSVGQTDKSLFCSVDTVGGDSTIYKAQRAITTQHAFNRAIKLNEARRLIIDRLMAEGDFHLIGNVSTALPLSGQAIVFEGVVKEVVNPRSKRKHRTKNERVVVSIELKPPTSSMALSVASNVSNMFDTLKRDIVELNSRIVALNSVVPPSLDTNELAQVKAQINIVETRLTSLNEKLHFDPSYNLIASRVQALKEILQRINDDSSSSIDEWKIDLNALKNYANEVLDSLKSDPVTIIEVTTCFKPKYKRKKIKSSKSLKKRKAAHNELLDDINEIVFEELR